VAFVYLVVVGSTALFVGFLYVLQRWTASATAYSTVLMPIVVIVFGALLAGETMTLSFVVGAAVVTAGVYIGALAPERRPAAVPALA
jgi:drug/metabolite transporter (DMT)-like permease